MARCPANSLAAQVETAGRGKDAQEMDDSRPRWTIDEWTFGHQPGDFPALADHDLGFER